MSNSTINKKAMEKAVEISMRVRAHEVFQQFVKSINERGVIVDGSNELLSLIDELVIEDKEGRFHTKVQENTILYRARLIDIKDINTDDSSDDTLLYGFGENGSREAPLGKATSGRNNISGMSYLYLANRPETACSEIKPVVGQLISLATFKVTSALDIYDFASEKTFSNNDSDINLGTLFADIMHQYYTPIYNPDEYRATQVLTDHLRKSGIDGINYRSHYDQKGLNYTIFNSHRSKIEFVESRVLELQSERRTFLDFNNKSIISASTIGNASYDDNYREKRLSDIVLDIADNDIFQIEKTLSDK